MNLQNQSWLKKAWPVFLIIILSALLYANCLSFSLLPYDDNYNIYENPHLLSGDWLYFWKNSYVHLYVPVTYTIWTWTYLLRGVDAAAFHFLNISFHIANGLLIFSILTRLKNSKTASFIGAMIFLVHPLQVEAVAWATSLKDTLSFFFILLSTFSWLFYPRRKVLAVILFFLALFSKPSAVALPVLLGMISFWRSAESGFVSKIKKTLFENWILLLAQAGSLPVILFSSRQQAAEVNLDAIVTTGQRAIIVLDAIGFYVKKIFLPLDLFANYGRSPRVIFENADWYLNSAIATLVLLLLIYFLIPKGSAEDTASDYRYRFFLGFAITLYLPISGIVSFGYQSHSTTADRYMYPILFSVAALIAWLYDKFLLQSNKKILTSVLFLYLIVLAFASHVQSFNWKDSSSFYKFAYEGLPNSYKTTQNAAVAFQKEGDIETSTELFLKAQKLDPTKLPPIAGFVSNLYNQRRYAELDEFAKSNLNLEKLKKMSPSIESSVVIYQVYAMANLDRNRPAKALPILCIANEIVQKPSPSFEHLLESTRQKVPANEQYCPPSLSVADKELFP